LFTFPLTVVISHFLLKKKSISIFEKMEIDLFVFFFFWRLDSCFFRFQIFHKIFVLSALDVGLAVYAVSIY
jgi:hypothetical protein